VIAGLTAFIIEDFWEREDRSLQDFTLGPIVLDRAETNSVTLLGDKTGLRLRSALKF
jgi:hypothetical protein